MQETENQSINILEYQKIGKNGNPYDILDDKIAEHLTQTALNMFVLNGQPYLYHNGYFKRDEDGKVIKGLIKRYIYPDLVTISRINRVYNLILADYRLTKKNEDINNYPVHWVNFKNGMYDPVAEVLREHHPKYLSINQIPHEYDPRAEYIGTVAEQFFNGLFPDMQDREMFFAYAGYCMTTDTRLQKFLVITGAPGCGKSTAINMLISVVGAENVSGVTLQELGDRFTPTELLGKLLNACADLPKKALEQVDAIKRITGEDQIKGEYKGGKVFWFNSYAKLIYSANQMPKSYDEKTFAFFRRLLMIDVRQKGVRIKELRRGLEYSRPGFIKECVAALARMYARGGEIDSPNSKRLVHEYYRSSDSVTAFLDDYTERVPEGRIKCKELHAKYELYCIDEQLRTLSRNEFYRDVQAKGFVKAAYHGYPSFKGLEWKKFTQTSPTGDFLPIDPHLEKPPFD